MGIIGTGLVIPRNAFGEPGNERAIFTDVSETAYGSALGYEYQGNVSLSFNTAYGAWAATSFICNNNCIAGSLLFNSTIRYGTVIVENQFIINAYETNVFNYHIEHQGTENVGGGVLADTRLTINGVGQLVYNQAAVLPVLSSTNTISQPADGDWIEALGINGIVGYARYSDMYPSINVDSDLAESQLSKRSELIVNLYDEAKEKIVDLFSIKLVRC